MRRVTWALIVAGLLACVLWPFAGEAQTYVRPSKGAAFEPFLGLGAGWTTYPVIPIGAQTGAVNITSRTYDWTAFSAVQVAITVDNIQGIDTQAKYTFSDLGSYIRFKVFNRLTAVGNLIDLYMYESGRVDGVFAQITDQALPSVYFESGASITITVTPLPFATNSTVDSLTSSAPIDIRGATPDCSVLYAFTWTGTGNAINDELVTLVPIRNQSLKSTASNRATVRVCNAKDNPENFAYCFDTKLRDSMGTPFFSTLTGVPASKYAEVFANTTPISAGECIERYWNGRMFYDLEPNDIYCIANQGVKFVTQFCLH